MIGDDTTTALPEVTVYTDGACIPNPGPGGWAAVLLFAGRSPQELVGSELDTTNNRMELRAAIEALAALSGPHRINLYTDSEYLRLGITEWLPDWQRRNWRTTAGASVKNQDLWLKLANELQRHQITWRWTRGHAGHKWNERADHLAQSAIAADRLPLDDNQAIHLFTAAAYLGSAGRGGWGVLLRYRDATKTVSGTATNTSSNRMHLQSAVEGLRAVTRSLPIHLYTSSDYLKDGATVWHRNWSSHNWLTKDGKPVSHRDLWEALADLSQRQRVTWHIVSKDDMPEEILVAKRLASQSARTKVEDSGE